MVPLNDTKYPDLYAPELSLSH